MADYHDPNAQPETVSQDVDHLRECPICEQYRHVSWFRAGARGCWGCERHQKLWVAALNEALRDAQRVKIKN